MQVHRGIFSKVMWTPAMRRWRTRLSPRAVCKYARSLCITRITTRCDSMSFFLLRIFIYHLSIMLDSHIFLYILSCLSTDRIRGHPTRAAVRGVLPARVTSQFCARHCCGPRARWSLASAPPRSRPGIHFVLLWAFTIRLAMIEYYFILYIFNAGVWFSVAPSRRGFAPRHDGSAVAGLCTVPGQLLPHTLLALGELVLSPRPRRSGLWEIPLPFFFFFFFFRKIPHLSSCLSHQHFVICCFQYLPNTSCT
jgi:hypothetical protein